ncbi:hypothetical protein HPB48_022606 [Haemaphysalis longicornis]|uniref:Caspase family p20 domain-containing protein n=1 Tax=Haemaphysalis longicornis TaxID=44386 RepID=A0A9J6GM60_HAELO|nr:hypothetical protein HPB48_022606 [Haemaphysalis longicornis]
MSTQTQQLIALLTELSLNNTQEMKDLFQDVSRNKSHKDADCLVIILMSHGTEGVIEGTDGEELNLYQDVYQLFNNENCSALQGKPKLFFVQACRGNGSGPAIFPHYTFRSPRSRISFEEFALHSWPPRTRCALTGTGPPTQPIHLWHAYVNLKQREPSKLGALIRKSLKVALSLPVFTPTAHLLQPGLHNNLL